MLTRSEMGPCEVNDSREPLLSAAGLLTLPKLPFGLIVEVPVLFRLPVGEDVIAENPVGLWVRFTE